MCPAFQSAYILDDSTRNAYFSYAWQLDEETRAKFFAKNASQTSSVDTLQVGIVAQPRTDYYAYAGEKVVPWRVPKRTKYGIIKQVPYPIKNYRLRTAPKENILAPEPVSNDFVASDFSDSLSIDSIETKSVVAKQETRYLYKYDPKDNFNVEQEYYNKYFGQKFIDKRPIPVETPTNNAKQNVLPDSVQSAKKPFLKGLFKKKKESIVDPETADPIETPLEGVEEEGEGN
jgi:hypothetical protein